MIMGIKGQGSSTVTVNQKNDDSSSWSAWILWRLNVLVSAVTSLSFAFFAFGNPEKYGDASWWADLLASPFRLISATLGATANFIISTYSHLTNIPDAFNMIWNRLFSWEYWEKNWYINLPVLFLALTGSIAAGAVGFAAVAKIKFFTLGWAYANAAISGFIFFVTRLFGLFKIADKLTRFCVNQHKCVEKLTQLKEELIIDGTYRNVNEYLNSMVLQKTTGLKKLDESTVVTILEKMIDIISTNSNCYDPAKQADQASFPTFDVFMAVTGLICAADITPIFAQRFANGCDQLVGSHPSRWWNAVFASSNFFLYFNQAISLKDIIAPVRKTLNDPAVPQAEKNRIYQWLAAFAVANGFAARSLYNLVLSTTTNPTYAYSDTLVAMPGTADNPGGGTITAAVIGSVGVGILNTNFTISQANKSLFKPRMPTEDAVIPVAVGPKFTFDDVITYLKTTPLSSTARSTLNAYAKIQVSNNPNKSIACGLFSGTTARRQQASTEASCGSRLRQVFGLGNGAVSV
jgi:hypothetical protein